ncbi:hypothetical protein Tco_0364793 [Tanacetum coccineum]
MKNCFQDHAVMDWGKLINSFILQRFAEQVKTMKIQAGVQVSRPGELKRHLQLWKCFGRLYFVVIVLDRNIESMKKAFQDMLHVLGEVNPTHAYYNGSRTSKDNEDPRWSTSFKTRRTHKTSSTLEVL